MAKTYMLLFYAPWCSHCKKLMPTWLKFKQQMADKNIVIEEIDCDENSEAAQCFKVVAYPTIKRVTENGVDNYTGERTVEGLSRYASQVENSDDYYEVDRDEDYVEE